MGVISVSGPQYGQRYNVNIAGDQPTQDELQRINQWVGQQEQALSSQISERFGPLQEVAEGPDGEPETDQVTDKTAFRRGFERQGFGFGPRFQSGLGTTLETLGSEYGLDRVEDYGEGLREKGQSELARLEAEDPSVRFGDVKDVGTGLSFAGEVIGEEAGDLAIQTGATLAGAPFFGLPGMAVGRAIGVGYTTIKAIPEFFAEAVETQKRAGQDVSVSKAAAATAGALLAEAIADYFIVGKLISPSEGKRMARALKDGTKSAGVEGATEVTQQVIMRAQAGLPLDNEEAFSEYAESLAGGAVAGGAFGTGLSAISPAKDKGSIELEQDLAEIDPDLITSPAAQAAQPEGSPTLLLAAPEPEVVTQAEPDIAPEKVALIEQGIDPYEDKGFTLNEYNAVLGQVKEDGDLNFTKARAAIIKSTGKKVVPLKLIRDIVSTLESEGKVSKSKSKRAKLDRYNLTPVNKRAEESFDSLRRDTDNTARQARRVANKVQRLEVDLRYANWNGKNLEGKPVTPKEVQAEISKSQEILAKLNERLENNKRKLASVNQDAMIPLTESVEIPASKVRMSDLIEAERQKQAQELLDLQRAADARAAADEAKKLKEEKADVRTTEYAKKQGKILDRLKGRLAKMGLKDVNLLGEKVITDPSGNIAEGVAFTGPDGDQVIALSMGLYKPNENYEKRLGDVMNHEIIHALRNIGLFTNKELGLLSKAARKVKYVKLVDGKKVTRSYTYFQRAQKLNPELSTKRDKGNVLSALEEEAIAEMYRDYAAGKLKVSGQSRSLLKRISDFFRALVGAHVDNGFNSVNDIFSGISTGDIGTRARATPQAQAAVKSSRLPRETINEQEAYGRRGGDRGTVDSRRELAPLDGAPKVAGATGPDVRLVNTAEAYAAQAGIDYRRQGEYVTVDPEFAQRVTEAYEAMPHAPNDPEVKAAYADLVKQVADQYTALINNGYEFYFFDDSNDPYDGNPWNAMRDLRENQRMAVYSTEAGYGDNSTLDVGDNPLLEDTGLVWPDGSPDGPPRRVLANDLFRAVHDTFGHGLEGAGFRGRGEENAWQAHARLFTGDALKALTTETRGQNTWLNYGPYGEQNKNASVMDTIFAEQKIGLMPSFTWEQQIAPDYDQVTSDPSMDGTADGGVISSDIDVTGIPLDQQPKFSRLPRLDGIPTLTNTIRSNPEGFTISTDLYEPVSSGDKSSNELFLTMGEDGALSEFPDIAGYLDDYIMNNRRGSLLRATNSPNYPEYRRVLAQNLNRIYGRSPISVTRTEGYSDPFAEKSKSTFNVSASDVLFVGNPDEKELVVTSADNKPQSVRINDELFVVAPVKEAEIISGENLPEELLLEYLRDNKDIARILNRPVYLGGWYSSKENQYYLDSAIITPSKEEALYIASGANQLAIFDLNNGQEIRTNDGIRQLQQSGTYSGDSAIGYRVRSKEIGRRFTEARNKRNTRQKQQLVGKTEVDNLIGVSNPQGDWLQNKIRLAEQNIKDGGVGITGPTTAYTKEVVSLPVSELTKLEGALGEAPSRGQPKYDRLMESVAKDGFQDDRPILVGVNHLGDAYIVEGNNRTAVARDLGISEIPAEVKWYNGGEDQSVNWSPQSVVSMAKGSKFSRLPNTLTKEQRDASILDYLNPETGKPLFKAKQGAETLVSFANKLLSLRNTRSYDIVNSEQDRETVARIFAAEAELALLSSSDAIGWYGTTLKLAKRILAERYPEISTVLPDGSANKEYDPNAEVAFDFATAVASNGLAVTDNYDFAANQYDAFRASADGKFPIKGKGDQGSSMFAGFEFWNTLTDAGYSPVEINDLLMTEVRRKELDDLTADILGVDKKDLPKQLRANSKEGANVMVSVAYLLGPKIGNGFYRNLRGNFDPITMDRWWMRFMNRITGNPIKYVNPTTIENNIDSIWSQIQDKDSLQQLDRDVLSLAVARLDSKKLDRSDMQDLIPLMNEIFDRDFYKKAYKDKIDALEADGYSRKDEKTRRIAQKARPERTPFLRNVGTYVKNIKVQLQETPRTVQDRAAMRDVTARAKAILENEIGVEITNADLQALMWYAEKRIFQSGGVRKGRGEDNDYADGAIYVLKKRGVNDDRIKSALPDSERYRVSSVVDELKADENSNAETVEVSTPKEGDFFGPRSIVLEERGLHEDVSPEDQIYANEVLSNADLGGRPPVKFSRVPSKPYSPVRSPSKDGGLLAYAYGFIKEGDRRIPVFLPQGSHEEFSNGTEVGHGLYHIQRRMHDKELVENSNYKRVENAIYDLMRRWQNQNFEDGESVIGYPSRDDTFVLEWRNNLVSSAPPLQLVLERDTERLGSPVYYVKTFFPVMGTKERMSVPKRGVRRGSYNYKYSRLPQYARSAQGTTPFIGPSDLAAKAEMIRYTKVQDVMARALKRVPFVSDKVAEEKTEAFMTKLQDSMLPLGKMYDKLREKYGPNVITQDMDAYFQEALLHGVSGPKKEKFNSTYFDPVLRQIANLNVTNQESDFLANSSGYYKQILEKHKNKSHALANAYLYAQHAKERNARIADMSKGKITNGSGMSDAEANSIISFVDALPAPRRDVLRNVDRQVQDMIKQTNQVYIDGGLIPDYLMGQDVDDDTKASFKQYDKYVPLRGYADPEVDLDIADDRVLSSTNRLGSKSKPNQSALGRQSYAGDILANVAVQHHQAIDKAERNKVGQSLLKLFEMDGIDTHEFGSVLEKHPMKRAMVNGTIRYVPDREFNDPDQPILSVRRDGEEYLLQLEPKIATAMKGTLSPKQANSAVRFLHNITRAYASLLTTYNPSFLLSNWPRDIETAIFNSQQYEMKGSAPAIIKNVPKAYRAILNVMNEKQGGDPYWRNRYQEFYENGGQNVLNQMSNLVNTSKDIERTIGKIVDADNKGLRQKVYDGFLGKGASVLNYIEAVNSAVENSTRVAFFDLMASNLEAEGVPKKEALKRAAFAARNLTTNFSKGGEYKNGLNSLYLFFNASLQGSMAVFNSLANSPRARKLAGSIVALGFIMDQINSAVSDDDDEDGIKDYDDISEYTLGHNLILPDLNGDGTYVKIPMAYGLNTLFNFGRITSNVARGAFGSEGTYTPEQAGKELVGYVTEMINPFGGNSPLTFLSPTVGDLPVELLTNNDFRDAPIYKELSPYQPYLSRSGLYWSTTSPSAVWVSKFINDTLGGGDDYIPGEVLGMRVDIQPDVIEHIFSFMTGGVGTLATQTIDSATSNIPNAAMGEWESDMIRTTPFINKFLTAVTDKDRAGDYYEKRDDVFAVRRSFRAAIQDGDRQNALNIRNRYPEIIRIMEPINKIDRAITKLRKRLKMVKSSERISDAKRKELTEKIEDRILMLQNRGMELMRGI